MRPETWLPTWTVTMAESVPVAVTLATIFPFSTLAVSNWSLGLLVPEPRRQATTAAAASTTTATAMEMRRRLVIGCESRRSKDGRILGGVGPGRPENR